MATSLKNALLSTWSAALGSAGITSADLLSDATQSEQETGGGEANFSWGSLILRLVRDRGQDFVNVASAADAEPFFRLDDLGVAQGWRSIESVLARQGPIALVDELREIARHRTELENALAPRHLAATRVAVADACKRREQAFLEKLKRLAEGHH
jgi:hypothetical protein